MAKKQVVYDRMGCGNCGYDVFKVYGQAKSRTGMVIECVHCNSQTVIVISQPEFTIDWNASRGDGTLAVPPGNSEIIVVTHGG